jgi:hypothetical protein
MCYAGIATHQNTLNHLHRRPRDLKVLQVKRRSEQRAGPGIEDVP